MGRVGTNTKNRRRMEIAVICCAQSAEHQFPASTICNIGCSSIPFHESRQNSVRLGVRFIVVRFVVFFYLLSMSIYLTNIFDRGIFFFPIFKKSLEFDTN